MHGQETIDTTVPLIVTVANRTDVSYDVSLQELV